MKVIIEGKNIDLTEAIKDHVNDKLEKISKHYEQIIKGHEVKVKLSVEKNPRISRNNKVEITIFLDGRVVRSEDSSGDMYTSIDTVVNKLDRQIRKYKTRVYRSEHHHERPEVSEDHKGDLIEEEISAEPRKVYKTKNFKIHAMDAEEAIEHLDLIGHDFYVFLNKESNETNIVYLRKDGEYGLIQPK